jgi:hypothetical protein
MRWPPYLIKMKVRASAHACSLWLPLFLLWPVVLVLALAILLILLPFALLALILSWQVEWLRSVMMSVPALYRLVSRIPGLIVDVEGHEGHVYLEFV